MRNYSKLIKKKDEEVAAVWTGIRPPATQCKKCQLALPDTEYTVGAEKAFCEMYPAPVGKANGILEDKVECEFFEEKDIFL